MHVLELAHDRDQVASARAGGSSAMNGIEDSRRGAPRLRISLPLCFLASFGLHAALLAMSSTWMSGGESLRSRESRDATDEELETYTIYLRVPEAGAGGGASALGNDRSASESSGESAMGGARQSTEAARAGSADAPTVAANTAAPIESESSCTEVAQALWVAQALGVAQVLGIAQAPSMNAATELATSANDSHAATSSTDSKSAATANDSTPAAASSNPKNELRSSDPTSATRADDPMPSPTSSEAKAATTANAVASPSEPAKPSAAHDASLASAAIAASSRSASASSPSTPLLAPSDSQAVSKGVAGDASASAQGNASEHAGAALGNDGGGAHTTESLGAEHGEGNGAGGTRSGAAGGGGTAPGAVLTFGPRPAYPPESVRRGEEGRVLCALHIDVRGTVTRVDVLRSSGHGLLDQAAVDALMRWRFLPAQNDGRAVACRVPHWVTFRLE